MHFKILFSLPLFWWHARECTPLALIYALCFKSSRLVHVGNKTIINLPYDRDSISGYSFKMNTSKSTA